MESSEEAAVVDLEAVRKPAVTETIASLVGLPATRVENLDTIVSALSRSLLDGTYEPGMVRRVWITKSGGGERGLGVPNVVDRMVQQAVHQVLAPHYEPTFHGSSHGFRPDRSCHTAIAEARQRLEAGYTWVVDLDLEKFFDRVHHQRLLARLVQRVLDRRLLKLICRMLKARVVMPDGVVVSTEEGAPQGGPLSPLLSNIVLDELDWELDRRGHHFVRCADDCNIYVRSEFCATWAHLGRAAMARVESQASQAQGPAPDGAGVGIAVGSDAGTGLRPPGRTPVSRRAVCGSTSTVL